MGTTPPTYTIKSGDTLSEIAQELGLDMDDIIKLNPERLKNPDVIQAGWEITLPEANVKTPQSSPLREQFQQSAEQASHHTVQRGNTLSQIAKEHGLSVNEIVELNKNKYPGLEKNPGLIHVGWELNITKQQPETAEPSTVKPQQATPAEQESAIPNAQPRPKPQPEPQAEQAKQEPTISGAQPRPKPQPEPQAEQGEQEPAIPSAQPHSKPQETQAEQSKIEEPQQENEYSIHSMQRGRPHIEGNDEPDTPVSDEDIEIKTATINDLRTTLEEKGINPVRAAILIQGAAHLGAKETGENEGPVVEQYASADGRMLSGIAWCASFGDWCYDQIENFAGVGNNSFMKGSMRNHEMLNWVKNNYPDAIRDIKTYTPQAGDFMIIDRIGPKEFDHFAIIGAAERTDNGEIQITTLDGNSGDQVSVRGRNLKPDDVIPGRAGATEIYTNEHAYIIDISKLPNFDKMTNSFNATGQFEPTPSADPDHELNERAVARLIDAIDPPPQEEPENTQENTVAPDSSQERLEVSSINWGAPTTMA